MRYRVGWYDTKTKNYGHTGWMTYEDAEKVKKAMKAENPDWTVTIYEKRETDA